MYGSRSLVASETCQKTDWFIFSFVASSMMLLYHIVGIEMKPLVAFLIYRVWFSAINFTFVNMAQHLFMMFDYVSEAIVDV